MRIASRTPGLVKDATIALFEGRREGDIFRTFYRLNTKVVELHFVSSSAITAMLGPAVVFELLWIRMLGHPRGERWRSNIGAVMRKGGLPHNARSPLSADPSKA